MKTTFEYTRAEILEAIRDIREITISLNSIGSVAEDMPENQWKEAVIEYLIDTKVIERLSNSRMIIESKFDDEPCDEDDKTQFERETENIEYWSFKDYKNRHGL